jgi:hypothetical protein
MRNEDAVNATRVGITVGIWDMYIDLESVSNLLVAIQQLTKGLKKALPHHDQRPISRDMLPKTWPTISIRYEDGRTGSQPSTAACYYHSAAVDRTKKVSSIQCVL